MKDVSIYEEISEYQPKELTEALPSITLIRELREKRKINDSEYEKFWSSNREWLEKRWKEQEYNQRIFLRLYELYKSNEDNEYTDSLVSKLGQFKSKIMSYDYTYPALRIDFLKYTFFKKERP